MQVSPTTNPRATLPSMKQVWRSSFKVARTYHAWRGEKDADKYTDVPGFCQSATTDEITSHDFILTPSRYVGAEELEDDDEPFEDKMKRLTATLNEQFQESAKLEKAIRTNLKGLGFEV